MPRSFTVSPFPLIQAFEDINFLLRIILASFHKLWYVQFLSFYSNYFLISIMISSLIHGLFSTFWKFQMECGFSGYLTKLHCDYNTYFHFKPLKCFKTLFPVHGQLKIFVVYLKLRCFRQVLKIIFLQSFPFCLCVCWGQWK